MPVGPAQLQQLQAVFGSRIPKDPGAALAMLEQSPAAPVSAAERLALREAATALAGRELAELRPAADLVAQSKPVDAGQRALPAGLAVQLQQMTGADLGAVPLALGGDKVITPARAQALFDAIAGDPEIPHTFIDDGCHFRSTMAAKTLDDAGVFCERVVINADRSDLRINSPHSPIGFTLGMFHMATTVWVDDGKGPERRVIDPSLGDRPLSLDEWSSHMHGLNRKPCDIYFLPRFCSHPMDRDDPPSAWREKDLEEARQWSTDFVEVKDAYEADGSKMILETERMILEQHLKHGEMAPGWDAAAVGYPELASGGDA